MAAQYVTVPTGADLTLLGDLQFKRGLWCVTWAPGTVARAVWAILRSFRQARKQVRALEAVNPTYMPQVYWCDGTTWWWYVGWPA
jgi:hypothetical protein